MLTCLLQPSSRTGSFAINYYHRKSVSKAILLCCCCCCTFSLYFVKSVVVWAGGCQIHTQFCGALRPPCSSSQSSSSYPELWSDLPSVSWQLARKDTSARLCWHFYGGQICIGIVEGQVQGDLQAVVFCCFDFSGLFCPPVHAHCHKSPPCLHAAV